MRRIWHLILILFASLSVLPPAMAQGPTTPAPVTTQPPTPAPLTLAKALNTAPLSSRQVVLAIAAQRIRLPHDAIPPDAGASVTEVATTFNRIASTYGRVTAVVPPTMTVVNATPSDPDIFADLPAGDKFKIFAASLSDAQWQMFTGEQGLGLTDLTTDRQRAMFRALFPKHMTIQPRPVGGQTIGPADNRDVTAELPQARLRFGQRIDLMARTPDNSSVSITDWYKPDGPLEYVALWEPDRDDATTTFGVPVQAEVPNTLKGTPLDWSSRLLQTPIPLADIKTIGELMAAIGRATHLELYADARWEGATVMFWGAATASARDLLQALAVCVTGTYRPVGPAFVLTDDLVGAGTRQQIWAEFAEEVRLKREVPLSQATEKIGTHSSRTLSWFGDPLAFSPEQVQKTERHFPRLEAPLSQLTPGQQAAARGLAAQLARDPVKDAGGSASLQIDLTKTMSLEARPFAQILLPSQPAPIVLDGLNRELHEIGQVFTDSEQEELREAKQTLARRTAATPAPAVPSVKLEALIRPIPQRAVLASPRTADEVDTLVTAMTRLGLNQLWLDVFSDGVCHIPGSALSPAAPLPPGQADILTEALKVTQRTGIQVYPSLDLLAWGKSTPAEVRDRTLRGEDTLQDDDRLQERDAPIFDSFRKYTAMGIMNLDPPMTGFGNIRVSPLSPAVRQPLTALVKMLATLPGVAGLVWRDTVSPGYDVPVGEAHDSVGEVAYRTPLGYTEDARLAFLRRTHVDPLDISPSRYGGGSSYSLLLGDSSMGPTLRQQWSQFRSEADLVFMRELFAAAQSPISTKRPLLVQQRRDYDTGDDGTAIWFGSWDSPQRPLPAFHRAGEDVEEGQSWPAQQDARAQAKSQSHTALIRLRPRGLPTPMWLAEQINQMPKTNPWDGFVLDLTPRTVFGMTVGVSATERSPLRMLTPPTKP